MPEQPFWEVTYDDLEAADAFGAPSEEFCELVLRLQHGAAVLDLGCGEGRNALFLAANGCRVTALDISEAGIRKLRRRAQAQNLAVDAHVKDLRSYTIAGEYDLIIAHGVLHLLEPIHRNALIAQMQMQTKPGGYNVAVAFTDTLPSPEDLAPFTIGLFREGELFERYAGWDLLRATSYVLEDKHPGGIRHRHPINKLVARRPAAWPGHAA
jgi:tellurite methyltransferase